MKSCSQKRLIKAHNSGVSCVAGVRQEFLPCTALHILEGLTPQEGAELELSFWKGALIKPPPSACMAQTQPTPGKPCSSPAVTCRDSRRATCGWHRPRAWQQWPTGCHHRPASPARSDALSWSQSWHLPGASLPAENTAGERWASWANSQAPLLSQPPSSSATHVRRLFQWEGFHLFIYWRGARDDEGHGNEQERAQQYLRTQAGTHTGIQRATPSQRRPPALKLRVCGVWGGWWRRECAAPAISAAVQYAISAT